MDLSLHPQFEDNWLLRKRDDQLFGRPANFGAIEETSFVTKGKNRLEH